MGNGACIKKRGKTKMTNIEISTLDVVKCNIPEITRNLDRIAYELETQNRIEYLKLALKHLRPEYPITHELIADIRNSIFKKEGGM